MKQLKTNKLPLNRAIISDILLWLVLGLALVYVVYFFSIALPAKRGQIITLHFHNANEISKGSPVHMMGTDIGFVSNLQIQNDYVAVTIQTYPGTLPLPSGATFNILFTGLAGAKSVEVEVPESPQPTVNGQPVYLVEEPVRMRDSLNATIDVTQALQKGAENITDFFGKKKPVEELQFNIRQAHQMSTTAANNTMALNQAITDFHQEIQTDSQPATATLRELTPGTAEAASITNPTTALPQLRHFFAALQRLSLFLHNLDNGQLQQKLTHFNQINGQVNQGAQNLTHHINQTNLKQWVQNTDDRTGRVSRTLDRVVIMTGRDYSPALQHARHEIRSFNQTLIQTNAKFSAPNASPKPNQP